MPKHAAPTPFAQWLKQRRAALDLTQENLAERVNCSVVTISKIEMGQRRPSQHIAALMAAALHVPDRAHGDFVRFARGLDTAFVEHAPDAGALEIAQAKPLTLPTAATPLIGREREIALLSHRLHDPGCRLITLSGPGGVGKTHLALHVAARHRPAMPDGACFVPLSALSAAHDIPGALADALGITLGGGEIAPQLDAALRQRRMLLVLDNVEHLLSQGGAQIILTLLARAPGVKVLVTSREPLRVAAEWDLRLIGLSAPAGDAAQLFVQAAQRADAKFEPSAGDIGAIDRVCRIVDGVPLAIELAATWVTTLTSREIADELERSLDLLSGPAHDRENRHRSIRAVFEHSWRLLTDQERRALATLSVFRGGFTRDAAHAVAEASLPVLSSLQAKSLIRRTPEGRFDLHELVRQFAAEQLARDPDAAREAALLRTHFFLALLREAEPQLRSARQTAMLNRLLADVDNLRAAWDHAVDAGWLDALGAAMRGLARLYVLKSWNNEGAQRLGAAAALRDDAATAHLVTYHAWFLVCLNDNARGLALLDEAFRRLGHARDPGVVIEPHMFRALALYKANRYAEAEREMTHMLSLALKMGSRWFEGIARHALAYGRFLDSGETERSFAEIMRAVTLLRGEDDVFAAMDVLLNASHIALAANRFDDADALLADCAETAFRLDNAYAMGGVELARGRLALARGDVKQARQHFEHSHKFFQRVRAAPQAYEALALLARLRFNS